MIQHYDKDGNGKAACGARLTKKNCLTRDVSQPTCPVCGDIVRVETGTQEMVKQYVECPPSPYILALALSRLR